jgi:hypothetical protein
MICRDLQEFRRVAEAICFLEHDSFALEASQEARRAVHFTALPRQRAVKVFDYFKARQNRCFFPRVAHQEMKWRTRRISNRRPPS